MATLRPYQFRLSSLIAAMIWASIASWALTSRSELSYSVMFLMTLILLLTSMVATIFQAGRSRAFAVGFFVFGFGHVLCIYLVGGSLHKGLTDDWSPVVGAAHWLNSLIRSTPPGDNFLATCGFAATTLLGAIGGLIASLLYSPQIPDAERPPDGTHR